MQEPAYLPVLINSHDALTINAQIIGQILWLIAIRKLQAGSLLPSVTQLAEQLKVNPNTIAAVYRNLAKAGYVVSQRGRGTFIANSRDVEELCNSTQLSMTISQASSMAAAAGLSPDIFSSFAYASALYNHSKHLLINLVFIGFSKIDQEIYKQLKTHINNPFKFISFVDLEIDRSRNLQQLLDADLIVATQKLWEITSVVSKQQEVFMVDVKPTFSLLESIGMLPYDTKVLLIGEDQSESEEMKKIFDDVGISHLNFQMVDLATLTHNPDLLLQVDKVCMPSDVELKIQQANSSKPPKLLFEFTLDSDQLLILKTRISTIQTTMKIHK